MLDENGQRTTLAGWLMDLRTIAGFTGAMLVSLFAYIGWGYKVAEAPAKAEMASDTADVALSVARSIQKDVRIVFCTSPSFEISDTARAQLECWRVSDPRRR